MQSELEQRVEEFVRAYDMIATEADLKKAWDDFITDLAVFAAKEYIVFPVANKSMRRLRLHARLRRLFCIMKSGVDVLPYGVIRNVSSGLFGAVSTVHRG